MSTPAPAARVPGADTEAVQIAAAELARASRLPGWFVILWRNRKCRIGMLLLAGFIVAAALAPVLTPADPRDDAFPTSLGPSGAHWLGTTSQGEDVFSSWCSVPAPRWSSGWSPGSSPFSSR